MQTVLNLSVQRLHSEKPAEKQDNDPNTRIVAAVVGRWM